MFLCSYGLECLFRFYSYGLEVKFRRHIYDDFQSETVRDWTEHGGDLYGVEKFWAFRKYYKKSDDLPVKPELKEILNPFNNIDDFKKAVSLERFFFTSNLVFIYFIIMPFIMFRMQCVEPLQILAGDECLNRIRLLNYASFAHHTNQLHNQLSLERHHDVEGQFQNLWRFQHLGNLRHDILQNPNRKKIPVFLYSTVLLIDQPTNTFF